MKSVYVLHPEAFADLDDIRSFIAEENPDAADRVISEIFDAIRGLVRFPVKATNAPTLVRGLCGLRLYVNI
jgi:plasmid stabilization system protein ParE